MNKDKVKILKDKKIENVANFNYNVINNVVQNPIKSKLLAFKKTKNNLPSKDLF